MKEIGYSKKFIKKYHRFPKKLKDRTDARMRIFLLDRYSKVLNNHELSGKYKKYRSINITGDVRAIYEIIDEGNAVFINIGTHSELYK